MTTLSRNPPGFTASDTRPALEFEIFVRAGFSQIELSTILAVLQTANDLGSTLRFAWRITSDLPGLVTGESDLLVRAEPTIGLDALSDYLFVIGGADCNGSIWLPRARAMQKQGRPVFLLSEAAAEFIRVTPSLKESATAHWRDLPALQEAGFSAEFSNQLVAKSGGTIHTCAGRLHTAEIVIRLLSEVLDPQDSAELASVLMVQDVRGFQQDQPMGASTNANFLENRLQKAIAAMEDAVEAPRQTADIAAQVGISVRQLERLFMLSLKTTPARYYRRIRLKRARRLINDTKLPLLEIALACGFSTSASLAKAFRLEFGLTPRDVRRQSG